MDLSTAWREGQVRHGASALKLVPLPPGSPDIHPVRESSGATFPGPLSLRYAEDPSGKQGGFA